MKVKKTRVLSVFSLVAINVIAIDSLRTLPMSAEYGVSAIFYYLLAAVTFFIPVALVSAELATGWPETGGVYVWVREAFGKKMGFLTIWLQWFYNICWYPTIMSLIAVTFAYLIHPQWAHSKTYMLIVIMSVFWFATFVNAMGMRASQRLSNFSAVFGTLLPMAVIAVMGIVWMLMGKPIQIEFTQKALFPQVHDLHSAVLFIAILYGLVGMEMSASHAREVKNPQRDYPRAVLYSIVVILLTLLLGSLAISLVVPVKELSIIAGLLQAFQIFFDAFHMHWVMPILSGFIILGALGGAAAWMLGPSKGMLMASRDGSLPSALGKLSRRNAPVRILFLQGVIFTALCSAFILMPSVSSGFWVLTDITAILALLVYVVMFPAAVYLRYKFPDQPRAFKIPGGNWGIWLVCGLGLMTCLFAIAIGFVPPKQINVGNIKHYEMVLIIGVLLGCVTPLIFSGITQLLRIRDA